jgi:hypothetical protein
VHRQPHKLFAHYRKFRQSLIAVLGIGLFVTLGTVMNYDRFVGPTLERVAGVTRSSEIDNISSLVYLQGWQDAWSNLQRTNGLGLGFSMMGCTPLPDVSARSALANLFELELNAEDGSILFGKIVSEAGVLGILFFYCNLLVAFTNCERHSQMQW